MVGGNDGDNLFDTVESISTDSSLLDRKNLNNFPVKISQAAGATLGDDSLPYVCGGVDDNKSRKGCWAYNPQNDSWDDSRLQMSEERVASGSVTHPDHGWVIAGGYAYDGIKSSAEQTKDWKTFRTFASLPLLLREPGLVSLDKGGGKGDFFLTGGRTIGRNSKKAFIYDAGSWKGVADMPTARWGKE